MGKHLVLIGGGHAHMVTLANLHKIVANGHHVTVIGLSEHHYYSLNEDDSNKPVRVCGEYGECVSGVG